MKRFCLLLAALLALSCLCVSALALDYSGNLGNPATFETMTEVRQNASAAMQPTTEKKVTQMAVTFGRIDHFAPHPVMADYPGDTTYVYRSPDMYGRNAASRINTNLVVYSDQHFESKDAAYAYIEAMGLIDIINEAKGSVILVTPSNPSTGFTAADQKYYYALQTAMFSIGASGVVDGQSVTYVDAVYYGGYGYYYLIGIDGGATFINNYVVGTVDYASRIAGLLLIGGTMEKVRDVAAFLPVYLVNGEKDVIAKYEAVNGVNAIRVDGDRRTAYNSVYPVRKVLTLDTADVDLKAIVHDAYYDMFTTAMRGQEITGGLYSASTPYQGYGSDCAPYSLNERNAIINGRTRDGICEITCVDDCYAAYAASNGEYIQTWYEYLPEEVLDGTAAPGSIPLILANHGGGDDPRQYVLGQGLIELAGKKRIAILAPEKELVQPYFNDTEEILGKVLPQMVKDMLAKYPALDASRVYVTGFSMGGLATLLPAFAEPELFAAAFPQSGIRDGNPQDDDKAHFVDVDLPMAVSTSEYNMGYYANLGDNENFYAMFSDMCELNGMAPLPEPDFETYPIAGFKADVYMTYTMNDDYTVHIWERKNDEGIPMNRVCYIESIVHCLYPQHADLLWDFFKHYSRDLETGEIIYNAYAE